MKSPQLGIDQRIGAALDELRELGFTVVRGGGQAEAGAVDYLVSGPSGVFLINAGLRDYDQEHLEALRQQAERLFRKLDTWVTPVICLVWARRRHKPRRQEKVWIVHRKQLVEWISRRRDPVLEPDQGIELSEHLLSPATEGAD